MSDVFRALSTPSRSTAISFASLIGVLVDELIRVRGSGNKKINEDNFVFAGSQHSLDFWHPSLQAFVNSNGRPDGNAGELQVLLRLLEVGAPIDLDCESPLSQTCFFSDWILERVVAAVSFEDCARKKVVLVASDELSVEKKFEYASGSWCSDIPKSVVRLKYGTDFLHILLNSNCVGSGFVYSDFEINVDQFVRRVGDAFNMIGSCAPQYLEWIFGSIKYICPLAEVPGGTIRGGSIFNSPALVQVGNSIHICEIADTLIHEASHQYFYLAQRFGPLSADRVQCYFSPFVQADRDLATILMTFHAFGNALIFHRAAAKFGVARSRYIAEKMAGPLATISGYLEGNPDLTEAGIAIYRPLREHLGSLGG